MFYYLFIKFPLLLLLTLQDHFSNLSTCFPSLQCSLYSIPSYSLGSIGVSGHSLAWFANYLSDRVQIFKSELLLPESLPVANGMPLGSILGPTLSSIHLYADDTILYATGPSPDAVFTSLQDNFIWVQLAFSSLNLT